MQIVAESRAEGRISYARAGNGPRRDGCARSRSGPMIGLRMVALEAPKLRAEKLIEHVCGRTAHHIRKRVLVELEEKGPLSAVKC